MFCKSNQIMCIVSVVKTLTRFGTTIPLLGRNFRHVKESVIIKRKQLLLWGHSYYFFWSNLNTHIQIKKHTKYVVLKQVSTVLNTHIHKKQYWLTFVKSPWLTQKHHEYEQNGCLQTSHVAETTQSHSLKSEVLSLSLDSDANVWPNRVEKLLHPCIFPIACIKS